MSGGRSRNKGARWEVAVVQSLRAHGWLHAERRLAGKTDDTGDIVGIPCVVHECKDAQTKEWGAWMAQLDEEMRLANTRVGALVVKQRGKPDPADALVVISMATWVHLLKESGYG
jgi:hypothetical protein